MTPSSNPSSEELFVELVKLVKSSKVESATVVDLNILLPALEIYVAALIDAAQADILRTAIDNIHDEIDAGVPEDLASRTVLLQMEYDLKQLTAEQPTKLEGE